MADRYAVATGNWSSTGTWSATDGGSSGASFPVVGDRVFLTATSGVIVVTIDVASACRSLDCTGYTGTLTQSANLAVGDGTGGSVTLGLGMTFGGAAGTFSFVSTTTGNTITSNGIAFPRAVTFNGASGGWTLADAFSLGSGTFTITAGAFHSGGKTISAAAISSTGASTRTVDIASSTVTCNASAFWTVSGSNVTVTATGSTIIHSASSGTRTFAGGGFTYGTLQANAGASITITGANTFAALTMQPPSGAATLTLPASTTTTVTALTLTGFSAAGLLSVVSSSSGTTATISQSAGTVSAPFLSVKDSTATGGATFNAINSTNVSGNTGWVFIRPLAGTTTGTSTTAGTAKVTHSLVGTSTGVSTATAGLHTDHGQLLGTTGGTSSTAGALAVLHRLVGSTAGTSTTSAPTVWVPCRPRSTVAYRSGSAYRKALGFRGIPLDRTGVILTVEIAFSTTPTEAPVWTNISCHVRSVSIKRGRQHELDRFETGTASLILSNSDRIFDPSYTGSPYYPGVKPMRRIRIHASIPTTGEYEVFNGYIENWPQTYNQPNESHVSLTAVDGFRAFAAATLPESPWTLEVRSDDPKGWWRLGESTGQAFGLDSSGNNWTGTYSGGTLGVASLVVNDSDGAANFTDSPADQRLSLPHPKLIDGYPFTVEAWIKTSASRSENKAIFYGNGNSYLLADVLGVLVADEADNPGFGGTVKFIINAAGLSSRAYSTVTVDDGLIHHVVCVASNPAALRIYVDGLDVTSPFVSDGTSFPTVSAGYAIGNTPSSPFGDFPFFGQKTGEGLDEVVVYDSALSADRITAHYLAGSTGWAGDTTGERLTRVLDWLGWSDTDRDIDTGSSVLTGAGFGGSVLDYIQTLQSTEHGAIYMTADGKVRSRERHAIFSAPFTVSQATFGDSVGELKYNDVVLNREDQQIRNRVTATRRNGIQQIDADDDSEHEYFTHSFDLGTIEAASDNEALNAAQWIVAHYKDPQTRVDQLAIKPLRDPANLLPQVLGRDIGDRVTVNRRPQNFGPVITNDVHVEGITHDISPSEWATTWALSPVDTQTYWILETGALDETSRLAY